MRKLLLVMLIALSVCVWPTEPLFSGQFSGLTEKNMARPKSQGVLPASEETKITPQYDIAGYSSQGNVIYRVTISPSQYQKTILLTFAMHGFEDGWDYDGSSLAQIANEVIDAFTEHPAYLNQTRLIVLPCVNPDGLLRDGNNRRAGRCNGQGIDINRDFAYQWRFCAEPKYHTGDTPFATPEANLLKDLVLMEQPDLVIDFHGWLNGIYGDKQIGQYFSETLTVANKGMHNAGDAFPPQTFVGWAGQHTRAVMVEYANPGNAANVNKLKYSRKTIEVLRKICLEQVY